MWYTHTHTISCVRGEEEEEEEEEEKNCLTSPVGTKGEVRPSERRAAGEVRQLVFSSS